MKKFSVLLCAVAMLCACSVKDAGYPGGEITPLDGTDTYPEGDSYEPGIVPGGNEGEGQENSAEAGKVTAGEWRDLDHWLFWSSLMTNGQDQEGTNYSETSSYWGFYTNNRVAVRVVNAAGEPQCDVPVTLNYHEPGIDVAPTPLYQGRTDNKGEVNLWIGLTQKQDVTDASNLGILVNNEPEQPVTVTHWGEEVQWNECTTSVTQTRNIDIAFIVDATGSMSDEIDFLKADLTDIITKVQSRHTDANIRTAALFYRDEGDEYLTKHNNFTSNLSQTVNFIKNQHAEGGGDYPEAVHSALAAGLQDLSWNEEHSVRLAFMLLDAPPHHQSDVLASLQQSIPQYAKRGIRIIPVAASGIDKQTEFFLRFTAMATDGTYVFITNHSGIGGEHIEATVGDYEVELLNGLIVRLIDQYLQ